MFDKPLWSFLKEKKQSLSQFTLHDAYPNVTVIVSAKGHIILVKYYRILVYDNLPAQLLFWTMQPNGAHQLKHLT